MGYDVHITRKEDWCDEGSDISLDEWLAVVEADPEMRLDGYAEAQIPGGVFRIESPGIAVWTAWSRHGQDGNMAWFDQAAGNVNVKNPDVEILRKMWTLAQRLSPGRRWRVLRCGRPGDVGRNARNPARRCAVTSSGRIDAPAAYATEGDVGRPAFRRGGA